MAFSDGWWLLRVIWSESDTARVTSSPPAHNKTPERMCYKGMIMMEDICFSLTPPPTLSTGPPTQTWPIAPSNPVKHLHILEWWIGSLSLSHLPRTALVPWAWEAGDSLFVLSELNQPSNHSQLGPRARRKPLHWFPSFGATSEIGGGDDQCDVELHRILLECAERFPLSLLLHGICFGCGLTVKN